MRWCTILHCIQHATLGEKLEGLGGKLKSLVGGGGGGGGQ